MLVGSSEEVSIMMGGHVIGVAANPMQNIKSGFKREVKIE
jgi:hypothetical protein